MSLQIYHFQPVREINLSSKHQTKPPVYYSKYQENINNNKEKKKRRDEQDE